jgi:dTDP-4-amino-4,6-dideoxygalactose transaminase
MIPLTRPQLPDQDKWLKHFEQSRRAGQYTNFGPCFEEAVRILSWHLGGPTLPVANGTMAITVALLARGLKPGAKIGVPDFTMPATLTAVIAAGMEPQVLPTSEMSWCLDLTAFDVAAPQLDAAIVVSPFGFRVQTPFYDEIAAKHKIPLVYDFAGAFGQFPSTPHPVTYSFHATKNSSIGEGGCILFSDQQEFNKAKELSNFDYGLGRQLNSFRGVNAKMDEVHCAMVLAMMEDFWKIKERWNSKKQLYRKYSAELFDVLETNSLYKEGFPSMVVFRTPEYAEKLERESVKYGMTLRRYYHPTLSKMRALGISSHTDYFDSCLAFPSSVSDTELEKIVRNVRAIIG